MRPRFLRALPSVAAAALLALVARAQTPGAVAWSPAKPRAVAPAAHRAPSREALRPPGDYLLIACPTTATSVTWVASLGMPVGAHELVVLQPLPTTRTASDVFVSIGGSSPFATIILETLLGDAETGVGVTGTPMLSRRVVGPTGIQPELNFLLSRPIVTRPVSASANTFVPTRTALLRVTIQDPIGALQLGYDPAGPLEYSTWTASADGQPISVGTHPVMAHTLCPAGEQLRVIADQVTATALSAPGLVCGVVQEFTVPVTVTVKWVELAMDAPIVTGEPTSTPNLRIERVVTPGDPEIPILATATASYMSPGSASGVGPPVWQASDPFAVPTVLEPGYTYRLRLDFTPGTLQPLVDDSGGQAAPGNFWVHMDPGQPWILRPDADLAFRLIGEAGIAALPAPPECANGLLLDRTQATHTVILRVTPSDRYAQVLHGLGTRPVGSVRFFGVPDPASPSAELRASAVSGAVFEDTYPFQTFTPTQLPPGVPYDWPDLIASRPIVTRPITYTPQDPDSDDDGVALVVTGGSETEPTFIVAWGDHPTFVPDLYKRGPAGFELTPESRSMVCQVCGVVDSDGDDGSDLRVAVQRLRVTDPPPYVPYDPTTATAEFAILQRFQVAVTVTAQWVELAIPGQHPDMPPMRVTIVDMEGIATPPPGQGFGGIASSLLTPRPTTRTSGDWDHLPPFSVAPVLEPNHDYALMAMTENSWRPGVVVTSTAQSADAYYSQDHPAGEWVEDPFRRLSFRIIGVPVTPVLAVGSQPVRGPGFRLRLGPNPAGDQVNLAWSGGGAGRVRLEILDVRGRLIRRVRDAGPAVQGQWRWDGSDDRGQSVPAGVYFARVTGGSGQLASRQIVRIR